MRRLHLSVLRPLSLPPPPPPPLLLLSSSSCISRRTFFATPSPTPKTHYQVLALPPSASPAAIKKAFYALSKTHHPDLNPANPTAAKATFQRISEAYATLSVPAKRAAYDRSLGTTTTTTASATGTGTAGSSRSAAPRRSPSYASTGPAGGRPASGLSRRRSPFTGPPPSFYAAGGWGAHAAKRQAAHEASTSSPGPHEPARSRASAAGEHGGSSAGSSSSNSGSGSGSGSGGGGGSNTRKNTHGPGDAWPRWPGADYSYARYAQDGRLAHFDSIAHLKTHIRQEAMRNKRRKINSERSGDDDHMSSIAKFVLILGMLLGIPAVAPLLMPIVASQEKKRKHDYA